MSLLTIFTFSKSYCDEHLWFMHFFQSIMVFATIDVQNAEKHLSRAVTLLRIQITIWPCRSQCYLVSLHYGYCKNGKIHLQGQKTYKGYIDDFVMLSYLICRSYFALTISIIVFGRETLTCWWFLPNPVLLSSTGKYFMHGQGKHINTIRMSCSRSGQECSMGNLNDHWKMILFFG